MEIYIPTRFNRATMYELLDMLIDENLEPRDTTVIFNFQNLQFIEPVGITILGNLFQWLMKNGVECSIRTPSDIQNNYSLKYLDDSLFFERYIGRKLRTFASPRNTTIPLKLVSYAESYSFLELTFSNWLSNRLNVTVESVADIKASLGEIFNNIRDHAQENSGCFFAQHYPNKDGENTVQIAISDFGVGIPYNIQQQRPSLNDGEALALAVVHGFSTQTTPQNRGAGLAYLLAHVVNNNQGSMYIHSNHGILSCRAGNTAPNVEYEVSTSYYPGTLIELTLKADNIENILPEREDFGW
ncbi:TPA: ATP-binding protein [Bacillus cereus]|uniref:ATP-binding protein n=1 Tax=Bacillus TaxID=1386 RepID=UPI0010BF4AED|nr:ATP-binding protein [Bacillus cereus]HDR7703061.1 ATP-binding protein [Bacillus thuringiensis]MDZ4459481.1 ATP-binding protein [Bacillus cereus]MDZ4578279.1 ATP-binding protein [Bacillus cereus]TKH39814.1 ATP-binding protein [Bacillus cereus]WHS74889.1 ATP-binding protein [Bacillus cereus]